jgi:nitrogen-specific signal transduction histidine kinase
MEARDRFYDENILYLTSLEEVFGGFAHEIAQPLHTIMIASQVLQLKLARTDMTEGEKEFLTQRLNIVTGQVQRATEIIESLRAFVKGTLPQTEMNSVKQVFQHIRGLMGQQFVGRGIELVCNIQESLPPSKGDPQLLEGIIIQGLAFARDVVASIESVHKKLKKDYKKSVSVTISGADSLTIHMSWHPGTVPSDDGLPDAALRPGLLAATAVLKSLGGSIITGPKEVLISMP